MPTTDNLSIFYNYRTHRNFAFSGGLLGLLQSLSHKMFVGLVQLTLLFKKMVRLEGFEPPTY